jgi:hypothetical protein
MSRNRENVTWQSKDKTWNIGFFLCTPHGSEYDGYDPEWDVDYDYDRFEQVFMGHKTVEEAKRAASRSYGNYGGSTICRWDKENAGQIAQYEQMALWHTNPAQAKLNQKKHVAKLNREHAAKLKEQFAEKNDFKGLKVTVVIKKDDNVYTRLGMSSSVTGYVTQEGDWLVVEKVKIKNLKTGRLNRKLHEVTVAREAWSYVGNWYR